MSADRAPRFDERLADVERKIERVCEIVGDVMARDLTPGAETTGAASVAEIRKQLDALMVRNARIFRTYARLCAAEGRRGEADRMRRLAAAMAGEVSIPAPARRHLQLVPPPN